MPCPNHKQKRLFLERRLDVEAKAEFEAHLADCESCRRGVISQWRSQSQTSDAAEPAAVEVPAEVLRRVEELVPHRPPARGPWRPRSLKVLPPLAAALLLAMTAVFLGSRSEPPVDRASPPVLRGSEPGEGEHLLPESGIVTSLAAGRLEFSWDPAPEVSQYRLVILDDTGRRVFGVETQETEQSLDLGMIGGGNFYWTLTTLYQDGTASTGPTRAFQIVP